MKVRRKGITTIVALVGIAAVALLVLATAAPAGNRDGDASFDSFPGPAEVTFGKNISYRATMENTTGSTFTQVKFSMTKPTVSGVTGTTASLTPVLVYSSCEANKFGPFTGLTASGYACPQFPNLPANSPQVGVTVVWATPTLPAGATCVSSCSLSTVGTWTIKESNNTTPSSDTFSKTVTNNLLVQPNPQKSAGYAIETVSSSSCTPAAANVATNQDVNASNKIATAVCVGTLPSTTLDPGVVVDIRENLTPTGLGFTEMSSICIPKVGFVCPLASESNSWPFSPTLATFIFRIPETADWPSGEKLDLAYHNGALYTEYTCTFKRDGRTKIWTVTCPADSNGEWRFG